MITVGRLLPPNFPRDNVSDPNYVMLCMAKSFDVDLFLFEPVDVDYTSKTINGQFIEKGELIRKQVPIPALVDNHFTGIDEELSQHTTLARIYPGDTKLTTYRDLKNDGTFKDILIPTFPVESYDDITTRLDEFNEIVMKPVLGAGGVGVVKIAKDADRYQLVNGDDSSSLSEQEFMDYCNNNLIKDYILQPYILCRTKGDEPFDIRVWVVDTGWNKWEVALFPRVGSKKGILSNLVTGGYSIPIKLFLENEFGHLWQDIYDDLLRLGRELPARYADLIKHEIFDLGIDIGIILSDGGYQFKLFEANSMPPPHNQFSGGNVAINLLIGYLKYYHYLYETKSLQCLPAEG